MVEIYKTYDKDVFEPLHKLLSNVCVPIKSGRTSRLGFPRHRAMTLGITRGRFNGVIGLSAHSKKYPLIYAEVMRLGQLLCPLPFNSIHLNHNVVCPKHLDSKNVGNSMLVSFGDYTGCNIVIEGVSYDAKFTPVVFNGAEREHWNTEDLSGNKYSLVYYWTGYVPRPTLITPYVIAIPSYNRPNEITKKTLKMLQDGGVNKNLIYIFVANEDELKKYESIVSKELYGKLVVGKLGIANQRIFIKNYFEENQYVVSIDDDVEAILAGEGLSPAIPLVVGGLTGLSPVEDISRFFIDAYDKLIKEKRFIWGIYPVRNPFFMKNTVTTDLKFIIGALYGFIVRKTPDIEPSLLSEGKEDYEQSILYYKKDGGVLRFNNITIKTKFLAKGGLGADRFEINKKAADYLKLTYPELVSIFHRKNGMTEIKLREKRPRQPPLPKAEASEGFQGAV